MSWDVAKRAGWMRISQKLLGSSRGTLCLKWTREGFGVQGAERSTWLEGCTAGRVEEAGARVGAPSLRATVMARRPSAQVSQDVTVLLYLETGPL